MIARGYNRRGRQKRNAWIHCMVFFGIVFFASALLVTILLVTRTTGREGPIFTATQTQRVLFGSDDMLNAGDVIEIRTLISNNDASTPFNNITLMDLIDTGTICAPLGMTNSIPLLALQSTIECFSIYVITQNDIDQGFFAQSTIASFVFPNGIMFNITVESTSDLRQTTFGKLTVDQMYTFDVAQPGFLDVDDLLRVTVKIMNMGTETLLNLTSSSFDGVLQAELLPMESVNFTYTLNLTLVDFNLTFVLLNETASSIGRTSARPVEDNSLLIVNSTRVPYIAFSTSTSLRKTTTCAQLGNVALVEVLLENTGTSEATNVVVTSSLVGTNLICGPMGTSNMVEILLPGQIISCNGGYMLTGFDVRYGYDTYLSTSTTAAASNVQQVFMEPIVNLTYTGVSILSFNYPYMAVNATNGLSFLDFDRFPAATTAFVTETPRTYGALACSGPLYEIWHRGFNQNAAATFKNFRINATKHIYAKLIQRSFDGPSGRFTTNPPNLFGNWTLKTYASFQPDGVDTNAVSWNPATGVFTKVGGVFPYVHVTIDNLLSIESITLSINRPDNRLWYETMFYEVVDTTIL